MVLRSDVRTDATPGDEFTVTVRRREFDQATIGGAFAFVLVWGIVLWAMAHGVNPLSLGWLLVVLAAPTCILLAAILLLGSSSTFRVDPTGTRLTRGPRDPEFIPWDRAQQVRIGVVHAYRRRRELKGAVLAIAGTEGRGIFLSSLRHSVSAREVRDAQAVALWFARDHGVEVVEMEILDRRFWEPLRPLRR